MPDQEIHWIVRRSRVHIFFSVDVFRYSCVCRTLIQFRIIWKWNTIISNWTNSLSYRRFIHTYIRMSCPQTRGSTPAPSTKPNSSESSSSSLSARPSSSLSMPFQKLFYTFFFKKTCKKLPKDAIFLMNLFRYTSLPPLKYVSEIYFTYLLR